MKFYYIDPSSIPNIVAISTAKKVYSTMIGKYD